MQNKCPLAEAALHLSSKWDLVVVYNLIEGPMRFSKLKNAISTGIDNEITSSSLTRILRKLEKEKIIARELHNAPKEAVEIIYSLTDKGAALLPVITELKKWGETYLF